MKTQVILCVSFLALMGLSGCKAKQAHAPNDPVTVWEPQQFPLNESLNITFNSNTLFLWLEDESPDELARANQLRAQLQEFLPALEAPRAELERLLSDREVIEGQQSSAQESLAGVNAMLDAKRAELESAEKEAQTPEKIAELKEAVRLLENQAQDLDRVLLRLAETLSELAPQVEQAQDRYDVLEQKRSRLVERIRLNDEIVQKALGSNLGDVERRARVMILSAGIDEIELKQSELFKREAEIEPIYDDLKDQKSAINKQQRELKGPKGLIQKKKDEIAIARSREPNPDPSEIERLERELAELEAKLVQLNDEETEIKGKMSEVKAQLDELAERSDALANEGREKLAEIISLTVWFPQMPRRVIFSDELSDSGQQSLGIEIQGWVLEDGGEARDFSTQDGSITDVIYETHGGRVHFTVTTASDEKYYFDIARSAYGDFNDPFSRIFYRGDLKRVRGDKVRTGKVKLVAGQGN